MGEIPSRKKTRLKYWTIGFIQGENAAQKKPAANTCGGDIDDKQGERFRLHREGKREKEHENKTKRKLNGKKKTGSEENGAEGFSNRGWRR